MKRHMRSAACAVALLSVSVVPLAAPLAAQQSPSDYDKAVSARQAGDNAAAVALLDQWLAERPDDSDALVQRGYAHLALGNTNAATSDFAAALLIAPNYADAKAGLELAEARRDAPGSKGFLLAGGGWSGLEGNQPGWWEASLAGEVPVSDQLAVGGRATWYRRFDIENVEVEGRIAAHPARDLWLRASIGGAPSADFRPEIAVAAGADWRVAGGAHATIVSFDASFQRFPLQDVVTLAPAITQYFGDGRFSATLRGIGVTADGAAMEIGGLGRLDFAPDDRQRFFIGAARGPDTNLGVVTRVTSVFAGSELPLTQKLSLLPSIAHEWREVGGDRLELRIELKALF